jgi:hypothetical protein
MVHRNGPESMEVGMMKHRTTVRLDEPDESPQSFWELVGAWVIVIILLAATSVGLLLDHAATVSP